MFLSKNRKLINSYFLKTILEMKFNEIDVRIMLFSVENINPPQYLNVSTVQRILVRYSSQTTKDGIISMILKTNNESASNSMEISYKLIQEQIVYGQCLPRFLYEFYNTVRLAPILIHTTNYHHDILLLEDVTQSGFSTIEPEFGLDIEQSFMAIEKLAFLHAASLIDIGQNQKDYKVFDDRFIRTGDFHVEQFIYNALAIVAETIEQYNQQRIATKIRQMLPNIWRQIVLASQTTDNGSELIVLNHGDLCCSNIMFNYQQNELCDVIFIDFQHAFLGTPILDLIQFFATSVNFNVLTLLRNHLIYHYHKTLGLVLQKRNYPMDSMPTLMEFHEQFQRRSILEFVFTLTIGPYLRVTNMKWKNLLDELKCETALIIFKQSVNYHIKSILKQLELFDQSGLLDIDQIKSPKRNSKSNSSVQSIKPTPSKIQKLLNFFENIH